MNNLKTNYNNKIQNPIPNIIDLKSDEEDYQFVTKIIQQTRTNSSQGFCPESVAKKITSFEKDAKKVSIAVGILFNETQNSSEFSHAISKIENGQGLLDSHLFNQLKNLSTKDVKAFATLFTPEQLYTSGLFGKVYTDESEYQTGWDKTVCNKLKSFSTKQKQEFVNALFQNHPEPLLFSLCNETLLSNILKINLLEEYLKKPLEEKGTQFLNDSIETLNTKAQKYTGNSSASFNLFNAHPSSAKALLESAFKVKKIEIAHIKKIITIYGMDFDFYKKSTENSKTSTLFQEPLKHAKEHCKRIVELSFKSIKNGKEMHVFRMVNLRYQFILPFDILRLISQKVSNNPRLCYLMHNSEKEINKTIREKMPTIVSEYSDTLNL